jgi:hypothetical protein
MLDLHKSCFFGRTWLVFIGAYDRFRGAVVVVRSSTIFPLTIEHKDACSCLEVSPRSARRNPVFDGQRLCVSLRVARANTLKVVVASTVKERWRCAVPKELSHGGAALYT